MANATRGAGDASIADQYSETVQSQLDVNLLAGLDRRAASAVATP
jgi:hypothetical protein